MSDVVTITRQDVHQLQVSTDQHVVVSVETVHQVVSAGVQGPRGASGQDGQDGSIGTVFDFAFGDATPAFIRNVPAGKRIYSIGLHIHTPFDGTGAELRLGTAETPDALMTAVQNSAVTAGQYEVYPDADYPEEIGLYLYITPGDGASQGAGQALIVIEP